MSPWKHIESTCQAPSRLPPQEVTSLQVPPVSTVDEPPAPHVPPFPPVAKLPAPPSPAPPALVNDPPVATAPPPAGIPPDWPPLPVESAPPLPPLAAAPPKVLLPPEASDVVVLPPVGSLEPPPVLVPPELTLPPEPTFPSEPAPPLGEPPGDPPCPPVVGLGYELQAVTVMSQTCSAVRGRVRMGWYSTYSILSEGTFYATFFSDLRNPLHDSSTPGRARSRLHDYPKMFRQELLPESGNVWITPLELFSRVPVLAQLCLHPIEIRCP